MKLQRLIFEEVALKPGAKTEMTERPPHVIYVLKGGKVRVHYPDGKTEDAELKTGGVEYVNRGI